MIEESLVIQKKSPGIFEVTGDPDISFRNLGRDFDILQMLRYSDTDYLIAGYKKGKDGKWRLPSPKCNCCSKETTKACGKCRKVFYCSKECQNKEWKFHKDICCK